MRTSFFYKTFVGILLVCLLQQTIQVLAQSKSYQLVFFRIESVTCQNNICKFWVNGGRDAGLTGENDGIVVLRKKGDQERSGQVKGVTFAELRDRGASFRVKITEDKEIIEGDILAIKVMIPDREKDNIFYDLAIYGTFFQSIWENKAFTYADAFEGKLSPQRERVIIDSLLQDIKFVGKYYQKDKEQYPVIKSGKFSGLNILDAMLKVTEKDLRAFLRYAATHRAYMANTWVISETYATWLNAGAPMPPTDEELRDMLVQAYGKEEKLKEVAAQNEVYLTDNFLNFLEVEAERNRDERRYAQAHTLVDIAIQCAKWLEKGELLGGFYFTKAGFYSKEYRMEETVKTYEEAYKAYLADDNSTMAFVTLINVGDNYNDLGRFEQAQKSLTRAYQLYLDVTEKKKQNTALLNTLQPYAGLCLRNLGDSYFQMSQYDKAVEAYQTALSHFNKTTNKDQKNMGRQAATYTRLAKTYNQLGKVTEREKVLQDALSVAEQLEDKSYLAETYKTMGVMYADMAQLSKAESYHLKAYQLFVQLKNKSEQVYSLANLGNIRTLENDLKKAEEYYNQALQIAQEIKEEHIQNICFRRLGNLELQKGNSKKAQEYFEKALTITQKTQDKQDEASSLLDLGLFFATRGIFPKAQDLYQKALAIAQETKDAGIEANALSNLGWLQLASANYPKAKEMYQRTMQLYKQTQNVWGVAATYHDFANVFISTGEYQKAQDMIDKSDSLYQKLGSQETLINLAMTKGRLAYFQGDFENSLKIYQKATQDMQKMGILNENYCVSLGNQADVLRTLKRYQEAEKIAQEALQASTKINSNRPRNRAILLTGSAKLGQKQYTEAEKLLQEGFKNAQTMNLPTDMTSAKNDLITLYYETKQTDKALQMANDVIEISQKTGYELYLWEAYYKLGIIYKEKKDLQKSKEYLQKSVQILEKLRNNLAGGEEAKKIFANNEAKIKVYGTLIDVLFERQEVEEAMTFMQQYNFAEMQDKLKKGNTPSAKPEEQKKQERSAEMKTDLVASQKQLQDLLNKPEAEQDKLKIESLKKVMTIKEEEYLNFVYGENALNSYQKQLAKLRNKKKDIPQEMAVISYFIATNDLYIIVANNQKVTGKKVKISKAALDRIVLGIRTQIIYKKKDLKYRSLDNSQEQNRRQEAVSDTLQTDKFNNLAERAFMLLINPIHEEIKDKKTLAIIPSGKLYLLPFQIIGKTLKDGTFSPLVEQFNIFYTNLGDVFDNLEQGDTNFKNAKIIAFGNPDNSLPSTELEVIAIQKIFPNTQAYIRQDATEDKIKKMTADFNAIHFATHGNLDCDEPLNSYLTMAKSQQGDGKFKISELFNMSLLDNMKLVVLSACQTAVIDMKSEHHNDPVSPATAFINQNVKSVLASLWSVDDEATALLMASFYNNIKTMPLLEAIRKAQIDLSKNPKYASPYYWAPFVLIGNWK